MPVEFDEYRRDLKDGETLAIDPGSNAYEILSFSAEYRDLGFKLSEIAEEVDLPRGSLNPTLARLKEQGLVEHEPPYWSIVNDDRVAAVGATVYSMRAFEERYEDDNFSGWERTDVDPQDHR